MADWQDPEAVRFMLDDCETWAVVGLSGNESRTAFRIASLLQRKGKRIVPIHPDAPVVLGEQGYPTLADVPFASTWWTSSAARTRPGRSPTRPSRSAPVGSGSSSG